MNRNKKLLRSAAAYFAAACLILPVLLTGCAKEEEGLSPVVTKGLPPGEAGTTGTEDGYTYTLYPLYAEITSYSGSSTNPKLPDSLGGRSVLSIGSSAFAGNDKLESVELPSELRVIGQSAFDKCTALKHVAFPDTLESIGSYAFRDTALESLDWKEGVYSVGKYAFMNTEITALVMPQTLTELGKYAFSGCSKLESVTFSQRIVTVSSRAFSSCSALKEVVLPKSVTTLEDYCFGSCSALEKLVIPAGVASVGEGLLSGSEKAVIWTESGSAAEKCAGRNGYTLKIVSAEEMQSFYETSPAA